MPQKANGHGVGSRRSAERRVYPRYRPSSVAYVKVGEENGGIVLNLSESGLELSVGEALGLDDTLDLSLQLAYRATPIEATGRVVWLSDSKRTAGLQFVSVKDHARRRIQDWVAVERAGASQLPGGEAIAPEPNSPPPSGEDRFAKVETSASETSQLDSSPATESLRASTSFTRLPEPVAAKVTFKTPKIRRAEHSPQTEPAPDQSASRFQFGSSILTSDAPPIAASNPRPEHSWTPLQLAAITGGMVLCFAAGAFVGTNWMGKRSRVPAAQIQTAEPAAPSAPPSNTNSTARPPSSGPAVTQANQSAATGAPLSPDAVTVPDNSMEVTAPDENAAPSAVTLPQQAVTASASIAISVRQTAGIPAEPGFAYEHRAKRLEGSRIAPPEAPSLPEGISIDSDGDVVHLQASLDEHGEISDLSTISGRTDLVSIAENIVRSWLQTPARLAGKPVESIEDITITFRPTP